MSRWIGVRIEHPTIQYAEQSVLTRACSQSRTYSAVSNAQTEAEVELHVVQAERGQPVSLRKLHTFFVHDLPVTSGRPPVFTLSTVYDGKRQLTAAIAINGKETDRIELQVTPEERHRHILLLPFLLLLLAGGIFGLGFLLTNDTTQPPRKTRTIVEQPAPAHASDQTHKPEQEEPSTQVADPDSDIAEAEPEPEPEPFVINEDFTVYFTPNQTFLTEQARAQLREIAELLQQAPSAQVTIVGHTAIFGAESEQIEISRLRVLNARDFLFDAGWQPATPPQLDWKGPAAPVTLDIHRQHINRRVEIDITNRD